jgi:hypothetical protein
LCGQGEPGAAATARISIKTDRDFIQSGIGISFKFESNALRRKTSRRNRESVMPALVAGIHVLLHEHDKDVDGRDKPGHDGIGDSRIALK